jgi:hypothetical protein
LPSKRRSITALPERFTAELRDQKRDALYSTSTKNTQ